MSGDEKAGAELARIRQARLAAALRDNLRKRKAQARKRVPDEAHIEEAQDKEQAGPEPLSPPSPVSSKS